MAPQHYEAKGKVAEQMTAFTHRMGTAREAHILSDHWADWVVRLETWILMSDGAIPPEEWPAHMGRAQGPRLRSKPMLDRPRLLPGDLRFPGWLSLTSRS